MRTYRLSLLVIGLALASITGCKSTTEPSQSTTSAFRPAEGSTYYYRFRTIDTLGRALRDELDTITVIASGISYQGKSNVVAFRNGDANSAKISYLNFEANGDVSRFVDGEGHPGTRSGWIIVPVASKGSSSMVVFDSVQQINGSPFHDVVTDAYTYTGSESVSVGTETLSTSVVKFTETYADGYRDYTETSYWSPKIGFYAKDRSDLTKADSDGAIRDEVELLRYVLK